MLSTMLKAQKTDSVVVVIRNIGKEVNSSFADFAPVTSADGSLLIFTSRRPISEKEIKKNKESSEHIFSSEYNPKDERHGPASMLEGGVNVQIRNNSAIALSADGQRMLVYHDDENGNGDIYESVLRGKEWGDPVNVGPEVNSAYHESSAALSPDNKTLFFVSNRPGGEGGRDIWYCQKEPNGKWGKAINLGSSVNTPFDEEGVFMQADGKTLYYSSNANDGYGGYDIYRVEWTSERVSKPMHLGEPLNTPGDDVFFVVQANGTTAYYSSSKQGGMGDKDIYEVTFIPVKEEIKPVAPRLTLFKGIVMDEDQLAPIEAVIEIVDNEKHTVISTFNSNSSTGKFLVSLPAGKNYGIAVKAESYLFYSDNFNIPDTSTYTEVEKNIFLKKLAVGKKIILKNIYYDFNKATLSPQSLAELDRLVTLMKENATLKIEISSHTDSKGTNEYNARLSQARAQSVVDHLISQGVSKERLTAKGYGESQSIATNDTEEGRQMNRRTEFKILSN
jgi:outer membrane protein OmpA-like peptidoglycan-associated protein